MTNSACICKRCVRWYWALSHGAPTQFFLPDSEQIGHKRRQNKTDNQKLETLMAGIETVAEPEIHACGTFVLICINPIEIWPDPPRSVTILPSHGKQQEPRTRGT